MSPGYVVRGRHVFVVLSLSLAVLLGFAIDSQGSSAKPLSEQQVVSKVFSALNAERKVNHLPALQLDARLSNVAAAHNQLMAAHGKAAKQLPGEATLASRVQKSGFAASHADQNIGVAVGYTGVLALQKSLASATASRAVLTDKRFTAVGVDLFFDHQQHKIWLTEVFAARSAVPLSSAPAPADQQAKKPAPAKAQPKAAPADPATTPAEQPRPAPVSHSVPPAQPAAPPAQNNPPAPAPTKSTPKPAPPPAKPAPATSSMTAEEQNIAYSVLNAMNSQRAKHGLAPLRMNAALIRSARGHNLTMAQHNEMSHQLPGEPFFADRISAAGYNWNYAGENVGWNSDMTVNGAYELQRMMYNETPPNDGHRRNILDTHYVDVGIDIYFDHVHNKMWLTQDFGSPR
jgi:uncharacterized protein YkwD